MSTPSPLVPQGSQWEPSNRSRSFPFAIALIAALHVVGLGGLLFLGCSKEGSPPGTSHTPSAVPPPTVETLTPPPLTAPGTAETQIPPSSILTAPPSTVIPPAVTPGTIPAFTEPAPTGVATDRKEHKVKKGDTGASIAKAHNVGVHALMDANPGVDWRRLKVDQTLQVPAGGGTGTMVATARTTETTAPVDGTVYEVKRGDTLISISRKFGVSWKAIRNANNLSSDNIKVGAKLKIPPKSAAESAAPDATPARASGEPSAIAVPTSAPGAPK